MVPGSLPRYERRPSPSELVILIVSGPSGAGKTLLLELLFSAGLGRVVPYTTRQARPGERADVDFHFVDKDEFGRMILNRELSDWDFVFGNYYGYGVELETTADSSQDVAVPVVARMALRLRARVPQTYLLFVDAADAVLDARLTERAADLGDEQRRREGRAEDREHARLFDERLEVDAIDERVAAEVIARARDFLAS